MPSERVIWGPPGTGKTFAGMTLCREWAERGVAPDQIAYLAFTKAAAKAAATKIFETEDEAKMADQFPYFRTIHSLCYRALKKERSDLRLINTADMKQFAKLYSMSGTFAVHEWEDLADVYAKMKDHGRTEWDQAMAAYSFSRVKASTIDELDRARREPAPEGAMMLGLESMGLDVYQTFVEKYEKFKKEDGLIDFGDMLEFGARDMKPLDDVQYVVLDEAQDLAPQHHLIASRIFDSAQEIWWIGDDDQCQPAGTKVLISKNGNTKDISDLTEEDRVVGYSASKNKLVSWQKVLKVSRRKYTGVMYEIRVGDRTTRATKDHRFVVKCCTGHISEVLAIDLVPGRMFLPIPSHDYSFVEWKDFTKTGAMVDGEIVYSLDVDKNHTYVADGIITHNSIFKFSGASAELFLERAKRATYQIELRETRRFGQSIVDFSRQIIERVKNRHQKNIMVLEGRQGPSGQISVSGSFEPIPGDVMIMHRHVQGCQNIAQAYIDAGLPFRNERGRDPLDATKRIKAWQTVRALSMGDEVSLPAAALVIENLLPSVVVGANMEKIRLVVHGRKSSLEELGRGQIDLRGLEVAGILTPEGAAVIRDREYHTMKHAQDLEYYERVDKNGYNVDVQEGIPRITTIHGSKGRQAKQTIVFSEMGQKCWEDFETEHRLAYVAATRTETDLTICMENKVHWAEAAYEYPVDAKAQEEKHA